MSYGKMDGASMDRAVLGDDGRRDALRPSVSDHAPNERVPAWKAQLPAKMEFAFRGPKDFGRHWF
ncbi:MAG: hypothetical protein LBU47_07590 [Christensenellaceae bacterium]|jgi:hypothetical protein|nr:hypothetical protein [Christensenellaceae bacterium]